MSTTYTASVIPDQTEELVPWLREELARLQQALNGAQPYAELQVLHEEPAKLRAGMVCYFDGTDFNPGSGQGMYRRDKTNASWVFIG